MEENNQEVIDLRVLVKKVLKKKWKIALTVLITGIIAAILIVQVPRTYTSKVMLAPETESLPSGGTLGSLAASFGFDLASMQSNDAIYPLLYPDLFESNDFVVSLFDIEVETIDESVKTDYYDYLVNHQDCAPWDPAIRWIKKLFKQKAKVKKSAGNEGTDTKANPFMLSELETNIVETITSNISCDVDRKTDVITISVSDQDPLICATLADSIRQRLQNFITQYRTSKSRADMEYYSQLVQEAMTDYNIAMRKYSEYSDAHQNMILQSYISERDELENDMQMKYNTYTAMNTQLQAAKAKVQECTPAFTVLQNATVPIKAEGPKRMLFVLGMMFLAFVIYIVCIVKDDIF